MLEKTTVVTASDNAYAWGVLLMAASMRMYGMNEPILVGVYHWDPKWEARLLRLPNVRLVPLDQSDRRCVAMQKPNIMLSAAVQTPVVTWVDCDSVFVGNCSNRIVVASPQQFLLRTVKSTQEAADKSPETLAVWQRDVGERTTPRFTCKTHDSLISCYQKTCTPLLERWRTQMQQVLAFDVGIVAKKGSPYFQTDEDVLQSLLAFGEDVPTIDQGTLWDRPNATEYWAHLSYNPKPWQMWNPRCLLFYNEVMVVVDWLLAQGLITPADLPFALKRKYRWLHFQLARFALTWTRIKKLKKKCCALRRK